MIYQLVHDSSAAAARNKILDKAKKESQQNIYLIDGDVLLDPELAKKYSMLSQEYPMALIGGPYLSGSNATRALQAYNFLCNRWVCKSHYLLGGSLGFPMSLVGEKKFSVQFPYDETLFQAELRAPQIVFAEDLGMLHTGEVSLLRFVQRAWAQGKRKYRLLRLRPEQNSAQFIYLPAKNKIPTSSLPLLAWPFALLHLILVYTAFWLSYR